MRYIPVKKPRPPESPWTAARFGPPRKKPLRRLVENRERPNGEVWSRKPPARRPWPKGKRVPREGFAAFLRTLGFRSYRAYLDSPLWASIRERVMAKTEGKCVRCWYTASQVHHYAYTEENLRGEDLVGLEAICRDCHDVEHSGCDLTTRLTPW